MSTVKSTIPLYMSDKPGHKADLLFENQNEWLNTKEAAQYLRISEANLRVKVSRGLIPISGRLGRSLRFRREELDNLIRSSLQRSLYD